MKQLIIQGRYIILKRRICAFKVRADFENKRKTEVYYGFYNGHTGADRVCSQCGSRTGGNSCFMKTQDGSDRERRRGEVAS